MDEDILFPWIGEDIVLKELQGDGFNLYKP